MGINTLYEKLAEQQVVYHALKQGESSTVCYKEFQNGRWGIDDANYTNRLRLAYYLLYFHIEDEKIIAYLFEEELKDREHNSFQGIGSTLLVLTQLLKKYCINGTYADLLKRAKNANFDCACGYDAEGTAIDDKFSHNSLLDCIYLSKEMQYIDVMRVLVEEWKQTVHNWDESHRRTLILFNQSLGQEAENETLYQQQLSETLAAAAAAPAKQVSIVLSSYLDLIKHYLCTKKYDQAHHYCTMILETTDYNAVKSKRLFGTLLEVCLETIAGDPKASLDLWKWAKAELQQTTPRPGWWYGNLYSKGIAAAKAVDDSYTEELELEYQNWKKEFYL